MVGAAGVRSAVVALVLNKILHTLACANTAPLIIISNLTSNLSKIFLQCPIGVGSCPPNILQQSLSLE